MSSPRIAIVGAGIGGLTLAIELRRRGLEPQVYEQPEELREVGAAVALSANATRFLRDRLGVGEALAAKSADVDGLIFRDGRNGEVIGRLLSREEYHRRCGAPYYGVHRADLQQILAGALRGVGLHLGKRLVSIGDSGGLARLHFADGDVAEADLVVGADGAKSLLRRHVLGYDDARFSGCYGWRGIVSSAQLDLLPDPEAIQFCGTATSVIAGAVIVIFAAAHKDRYLNMFSRFGSMTMLAILLVEALVSVSVIVLFRKRGQAHWWRAITAPVVAILGLAMALYLVMARIGLLAGTVAAGADPTAQSFGLSKLGWFLVLLPVISLVVGLVVGVVRQKQRERRRHG